MGGPDHRRERLCGGHRSAAGGGCECHRGRCAEAGQLLPRGDGMKPVCVTNATVVSPGEIAAAGTVVFTDRVTHVLPADAKPPAGCEVIDGAGRTLTPGLVDLH